MIPPERRSPGFSRVAMGILLLLFVVRGIILLCVVPPFEGWDEYQHLAYIDHLSVYGDVPVYGQTRIDPEFSRALTRFPQPRGDPQITLLRFGVKTYSQYWRSGPPQPTASTERIGLYEAQHPPLYYRLMVPLYRGCGGRDGIGPAVAALRAVNLVLGAMALGCILWWIREALDPPAALMAGLCISLHPLALQNTVRVANDPLAILLGTMVICACLSLDRRRFWRFCVLIAVTLPLGVLVKAIDLTLLPAALTAVALCALRREISWKAAGGAGLMILASMGALTGAYFAHNLRHFGELTSMQEALFNHQAGRGFLGVVLAFPHVQWPMWLWRWWVARAQWVGGWSFLALPRGLTVSYQLLLAVAMPACLAALALRLPRQRWPMPLRHVPVILLVLACVSAGLMYHASASLSAYGQVATPPWYTMIGQPWLMVLLAGGTAALFPRRDLAVMLMTLLPGLHILTEVYVLLVRMIPAYGGEFSWEALRRLATLRPDWLGTPVLLGAQVALALLMALAASLVLRTARSATDPGDATRPALKPATP